MEKFLELYALARRSKILGAMQFHIRSLAMQFRRCNFTLAIRQCNFSDAISFLQKTMQFWHSRISATVRNSGSNLIEAFQERQFNLIVFRIIRSFNLLEMQCSIQFYGKQLGSKDKKCMPGLSLLERRYVMLPSCIFLPVLKNLEEAEHIQASNQHQEQQQVVDRCQELLQLPLQRSLD